MLFEAVDALILLAREGAGGITPRSRRCSTIGSISIGSAVRSKAASQAFRMVSRNASLLLVR
jgi:hypothetical protein